MPSDVAPDAQRVTSGWTPAAFLMTFAGTALSSRTLSVDSYLNLFAGRYIAGSGLPHFDHATVEGAGRTWMDQQWFAHAVYYGAWRAGGYALVIALSAALVASGYAILCGLIARAGVPPFRAFLWAMLAYAATMQNTSVRAQSWSFLCLALTMSCIVLDDAMREPVRVLAPVLAVLVLWANTHGAVVLGVALVTAYAGFAAARARLARDPGARTYTLVCLASPLTLFVTPYGKDIGEYYDRLLRSSTIRQFAAEWRPPRIDDGVSYGFFAAVALLLVVSVLGLAKHRPPRLVPLGAAALALGLASTAVRHEVWFVMTAAVVIASTVASMSKEPAELPERVRRGVTAAAGATAMIVLVPAFVSTVEVHEGVPINAIRYAGDFLRTHPDSRVLADDNTASPLLWLEPATIGRVGFDSRLEIFADDRLVAFQQFVAGRPPGVSVLPADYDIILVSRRGSPALAALLERDWTILFYDEDGLVAERRS